MGDVYFRCIGCQQSLVADETGVGVSFQCPHCSTAQSIPTPAATPQAIPEVREPIAGDSTPSVSSEGDSGSLSQNGQQSTEQAYALAERDQRISALRAECDWLASQLDEERQHRQALEPELELACAERAAAEQRADQFEAALNQAATRFQHSEIVAGELSGQLELVKSERSDAVLKLARQRETLAQLNTDLDKARTDRAETEQILSRARGDLDRTAGQLESSAGQLAAAQSAAEQSTAEAGRLNAALVSLRADLALAITEREKLQSMVRRDHELAEFVQINTERDRLEAELKEFQVRLAGSREKIDALTSEREALKRERTELQLKVAALRDAHDDTQLQQDNEVLRRMVERLNEELKEAQPEIAKKKRRAASGGLVGGLARAALARCLIPDPDVAEGQ